MQRTRKRIGNYKPKEDNVNKLIFTYGLCGSLNHTCINDYKIDDSCVSGFENRLYIKALYFRYKRTYLKQYNILNNYHKKCILNRLKKQFPKYFCELCKDFNNYRICFISNSVVCSKCNSNKFNNWHKRKIKLDDTYRFISNSRILISQSLRNKGYKKGSKSEQILGCEWEFFKEYIERKFKKGMTWDNYGKWHLDHIYPISKATSYEMALELNHYTNFQPLWAFDNISKNDKVVEHQRKLAL